MNYSSLQYQGRYRDHRWRKGDTADQVLHVVLYNGSARWDAPRSLAELVPMSPEDDGPAQLALSYDVVDLVAVAADDRCCSPPISRSDSGRRSSQTPP